jgi:hypothetical protein
MTVSAHIPIVWYTEIHLSLPIEVILSGTPHLSDTEGEEEEKRKEFG